MTPLTKRLSEIRERMDAMSAGQISGADSRAFYLRDVPMLLEAVEQCVDALKQIKIDSEKYYIACNEYDYGFDPGGIADRALAKLEAVIGGEK